MEYKQLKTSNKATYISLIISKPYEEIRNKCKSYIKDLENDFMVEISFLKFCINIEYLLEEAYFLAFEVLPILVENNVVENRVEALNEKMIEYHQNYFFEIKKIFDENPHSVIGYYIPNYDAKLERLRTKEEQEKYNKVLSELLQEL